MPRVAYVNGRYVSHAEASVHVEDRGFQFADAVYEVIAVVGGRRVDEALHLDRLERSLRELRIEIPWSREVLRALMAETARRNRLRDATLYLQISRGTAPRDHGFPQGCRPTLVITVRPARKPPEALVREGVRVILLEDIRWKRADIKSVSLLPNVLAKQAAREAGAFESWLVDGAGMVTEGASTNAWIVTREGTLVTRAADAAILNGVTRRTLLSIARAGGVPIEERSFAVEEAREAAEAFITSTSSLVLPVTHIDGRPVGEGRPGRMTRGLLAAYREHVAGEGV